MRKILSPWLLALVYALLTIAPAGAVEQVGNNWPILIQQLQSRGISRVGKLDLANFASRAGSIRWQPIEVAPPQVAAGSRSTAFYVPSQRTIYFRASFSQETTAALAQLELHELLGALKFNDLRYQASTALVELASTADASERQRLLSLYSAKYFGGATLLARADSEGGSSVSGGGDLPTLYVKQQVLAYIKSQGGVSSDFLAAYPNVGFEPLKDTRVRQVTLAYEYKRQGKGFKEWFSIYVPMTRWNAGERESLYAEIAAKVTAVFPARGGSTVSYSPEGCGGRSVSFPATNDPSVSGIQRERATIVLRCYAEDSHITGGSSISPAPPEGAEPRRPGSYSFSCSFMYPGMSAPFSYDNVQSILGRSEQKSLGFGVREGDYLAGVARFDQTGNITHLGISYKSPEGQWSRIFEPAPSANGGAVTMNIEGKPMRFSCERR